MNCSVNLFIPSVRRLEDLSDWLESRPIRMQQFSTALLVISNDNCDRTCRKSSSCPEVGRYAVYARILVTLSQYFTPQNLSDMTGNLVMFLSTVLSHPKAVPCQVGPDSNILSSADVNMSDEVDRKL